MDARWRVVAMSVLVFVAGCSRERESGEDASRVPVVPAFELPVCDVEEWRGIRPTPYEIAKHRTFDLPAARYAVGDHPASWGYTVGLRVDAEGRVQCHELLDGVPGLPTEPNRQQRQALAALARLRYAPFLRDGKAVAALIVEQIPEERIPPSHRPMPDVPLNQVRITLSRGGTIAGCGHSVEVGGDGQVIFTGGNCVAVEGRHEYQIPISDVRALTAEARRIDLWSMEPQYPYNGSDAETARLVIQMGDQTLSIYNEGSLETGVPLAVVRFQDMVERVSRAKEWHELSIFSLDQLEREGFDFNSEAGSAMLVRAIDHGDEAVVQRLVALGTPLRVAPMRKYLLGNDKPEDLAFLEFALRERCAVLAAPMIERGVLLSRGRPDQRKLDLAFRAAIESGRLAAVQAVWNGGAPLKPSLHYMATPVDRPRDRPRRTSVVNFLVLPWQDQAWEGLPIAQWLAGQGMRLDERTLDGSTLLHAAANANDIAFVRFLLAQGLDVSIRNERGAQALNVSGDEDIALVLLRAGARTDAPGNSHDSFFLHQAKQRGWYRVLEWQQQPDQSAR
ncbi:MULTISPECIES: ankyrin repeat domain-containing protein [unclassified Pseudoxanthomonas]|uniref:ankyrin repeat domain-containing protein n=1 Tax=unclassified Pseudoxanthomonas TaxID=2645906 RepID=UPI0008E078A2|nr:MULTISPECIES: ankyrin repeat domain-containing protein [unclassified Pseudoxanthomonas]SFV31569.1 hypothetical protein SAMN05428990_2119 [Pseudoxanthomonas sp. YR558]